MKKVTKFGLEVLTGKALSFWLEFSEPVKKVFVYKCKLRLSRALLYLVDLFINKLKTRVNEFKIIIFVLNYLTVLVYTKTIIHFSVGG